MLRLFLWNPAVFVAVIGVPHGDHRTPGPAGLETPVGEN